MDIEKLLEQRTTLLDEAEALAAKADAESRDMSDEEQKRFDAIMADDKGEVAQLDTKVERAKQVADQRGRFDGIELPKPRKSAPAKLGEPDPEGGEESNEPRGDRDKREYRDAWIKWFRHGEGELKKEERDCLRMGFERVDKRAATTATSGAGGGYTIPEGFLNQIQQAQRQEVGVLQAGATVIETDSGNQIPMPTVDDTDEQDTDIKTEASAVTDDAGNDPTFAKNDLNAYTIASEIVKLSVELTQDSAFDIGAWLGSALATRVGRKINYYATVGTGSNQPQGVVNGSAAGVTASGTAAITYDELVQLEHSVDPAYRASPNFGFMCSDPVVSYLRRIKDNDGRPILDLNYSGLAAQSAAGVDGATAPSRYSLFSRPLYVNNRMAGTAATPLAADAKSILVGDFSYYWARFVRPRMVVVRFGEKYMNELNVGFLAYSRFDGVIHDPAASAAYKPIKHLAQAST